MLSSIMSASSKCSDSDDGLSVLHCLAPARIQQRKQIKKRNSSPAKPNCKMNYERTIKVFSLCDKLKVVHAFESGMPRSQILREFGLPESTYYKILKNKDSIKSQCSEGNGSVKRQRRGEYPDVERRLSEWIKQTLDKNVCITGPLMKRKAQEFAISLGINNFPASGSWLDGFKRRNNIALKKTTTESHQEDLYACSDWAEDLPNLLKGFDPNDIYTASEAGLFFKCLPDKTFAFKTLDCHGGKQSSERITILNCTNMTGTDKLPLLIIGKSKHPACFEGIKTLPVDYDSNPKALMTIGIFQEWLKKIDAIMKTKRRNIVLFLDNRSIHTNLPTLSNVEAIFLPTNSFGKFQPFDLGISDNFKRYYRKEVVRHILTCLAKSVDPVINMLLAMKFARKAWYTVSDATIRNCFRKAGFKSRMLKQHLELEEDYVEAWPRDEDWCRLTSHGTSSSNPTFEDFVQVDQAVPFAEDHAFNDDDDQPIDECSNTIDRKPIIADHALQALETLHSFFELSTDTDKSVFDKIYELETYVEKSKQKQMKSTEYL